jgi:GNAT superfamily N-acetyltransferase
LQNKCLFFFKKRSNILFETITMMRIHLTPICMSDSPFLFSIYSETRSAELNCVPWGEEQKQDFLRHQFQAQHQHYTSKYKDAHFQIIKLGEIPIGRLYVAELADEIRIIDITILSEFRGKNFGTRLIEEILLGADQKNKAVQIYLETNDRSEILFTRLGFVPIADGGIYRLWHRLANRLGKTAEA